MVQGQPATVAGAQEESGPSVHISDVNVTRYPLVRVFLRSSGPPLEEAALAVRENGRVVDDFRLHEVETSQDPVSIALLIDTSGSMRQREALPRVVAAARDFVVNREATDRIALIAYSETPRVVVPFTSDPAVLVAGLGALQAGGGTALWDAVVEGAEQLQTEDTAERYIVVLSDAAADSFDNRSTASATTARDAAVAADATVFTIALPSGPVDDSEYRSLAEATGGTHGTTDDVGEVGLLLGRAQGAIRNQYMLAYDTQVPAGATLELEVDADGQQLTAPVPIPEDAGAPLTFTRPSDRVAWLPSFEVLIAVWVVAAVVFGISWRRSR